MLALRRSAPMAAAVAMVAAVLGGCGSSSELPSDIPAASADGLVSSLNQVLTDCQSDPNAAKSAAAQYQRALAQLPDTVDADVRKVLEETGSNLTELAGSKAGCETGPSGTSGLQGAQPTESSTTAQDVATTPSTTESTDTTSTPPDTETPPSSPAGGGGEGVGSQGQQPGGGPPAGGQPGGGQPGSGQSGDGGSGSSGGVTPGGKAKSKTGKHHPKRSGKRERVTG
jgi:hypothetical protein